MIRPLAAGALLLGLLGGCTPPEDEGEAGPKKVAFEGRADPVLAGKWETADGSSTMVLGSEGKLNLTSVYPTPQGEANLPKEGEWKLGDGKIRLRYRLEDGTEETVAYDFARNGEKITLSTKSPKLATLYVRKPD